MRELFKLSVAVDFPLLAIVNLNKDMRPNNTIFFEEDEMLPMTFNTHNNLQLPLVALTGNFGHPPINQASSSTTINQRPLVSPPSFANFADYPKRDQLKGFPSSGEYNPWSNSKIDLQIKKPKIQKYTHGVQWQRNRKEDKMFNEKNGAKIQNISSSRYTAAVKYKKRPTLIVLDEQFNKEAHLHYNPETNRNAKINSGPPKKYNSLQDYFQRHLHKNTFTDKQILNNGLKFSEMQPEKTQVQRAGNQGLSLKPGMKLSNSQQCQSSFLVLEDYSDYTNSSEDNPLEQPNKNDQNIIEQLSDEPHAAKSRHPKQKADGISYNRMDRLVSIVNKMRSMVGPN